MRRWFKVRRRDTGITPPAGRYSNYYYYTQEQRQQLLAVYNSSRCPTTNQKREIAHKLGITLRQASSWFNNRRYKETHPTSSPWAMKATSSSNHAPPP